MFLDTYYINMLPHPWARLLKYIYAALLLPLLPVPLSRDAMGTKAPVESLMRRPVMLPTSKTRWLICVQRNKCLSVRKSYDCTVCVNKNREV